ncbi:hypothetical protein Celaphus_00007635 [Cervus elaphus hippelaphus]|uniref:NADP-dependent oxidoreductase domain-containing protein n=1 Tax=Cervus elaphus hippelaphus TaxID=46360 RepID=A0A212CAU9_CEREH|nr:hypothetical protein Celaphus_00007635 [Cervus elaphus hippelaphus]
MCTKMKSNLARPLKQDCGWHCEERRHILHFKGAMNVECHPYLNQRKLLDFCKSHDIVLVAYAALGSQ